MADEEPVDPKKLMEDASKAKCARAWRAYEHYDYVALLETIEDGNDCVIRIKDDETGTKHCTGQYFDYWHCVDRCVAPKLFSKLK